MRAITRAAMMATEATLLPGLSVNPGVRALAYQSEAVANSAARLSAGLRVRSAVDDAGGLAISEVMRAQVRGTRQAARNIEEAMNFLQLGLDGLMVVNDVLQRMRELAVQGANGTVSTAGQTALQTEWTECLNSLNHARAFAALARLDFSLPFGQRAITVQVGADNGETLTVSYENLRTALVGSIASLAAATPNAAAIGTVDAALHSIVAEEATLGAMHNRLGHMLDFTYTNATEQAGSEARIRDADMAAEVTRSMRGNLLRLGAAEVTHIHNLSRSAALTLLGA